MPLIDSKTNRITEEYSKEKLIQAARRMRGINEIALYCAGSGHSGGTLGIMDICAVLYLRIARHDPKNPFWKDRDRIIWSAGHKAPALYTSLAYSGYFPVEELTKLRMLNGPFQGHPHWRDLPGVEISAGSLGQGVSVSIGAALAAKLNNESHKIFCITSDGEHQEGSLWEAAMSARHHKLDNLIWIVDKNRLQIDGLISETMNIEPLNEKYKSFGWHVIEVDGHNIKQLIDVFEEVYNNPHEGVPAVLICHTKKGAGVSFMTDKVEWHGKAPDLNEIRSIVSELSLENEFDFERWKSIRNQYENEINFSLDKSLPQFSKKYAWNDNVALQADFKKTRDGFGKALEIFGADERIVCLGADISDSIAISQFYKNNPERKKRFISMGIAEQNGTATAAGLAKEGKYPVFGSYGVFAAYRNLDQLRVSVCYANLNVLIAGAHGGLSVGPDGATHQEMEALFQLCGLPNMHVCAPCDYNETIRVMKSLLFEVAGPKYIRFAREATPEITSEKTPFKFGEANIFRLREIRGNFKDNFEILLSSEYKNEQEDITIISTGPQTAEALRAAFILKSEFELETRIVHLHSLKPIDRKAVERAAKETEIVITTEEHQTGGLGNIVAGIILEAQKKVPKTIKFTMIGVADSFGESGKPEQLLKKYKLSAEHIAQRIRDL